MIVDGNAGTIAGILVVGGLAALALYVIWNILLRRDGYGED